jgi:hypothetical protein
MRILQNAKQHIIVIVTGIILAATVAIALTIHYIEPQPLSDNEILIVHNAIQAVAPGDIRNLQQNRDGSVTAFVTSGHYSKQTVVARKVGDKWNASVTMVYF